MESRLYFFMVGRVEAEVRMLGVFLIQNITELLFLIKGVVGGALLMDA
jgi:hypothetical protein